MKLVDMAVELVDFMGDDLTVVNAARVSFDKESDWIECADEFGKLYLKDNDAKLIKYLAKHNHWSPFAHCSASFRVKAPLFIARQLQKHQVGFAWNEVSRRYVDNEPEFYIPYGWRARADNVKQGSSSELVQHKMYADDIYKLQIKESLWCYKRLLEIGVCPEQARLILPGCTMTEWIWTGSLYGWSRVCKLRLSEYTQKETQTVARAIDSSMSKLYPESWSALMEV
jgi:thymidylate synthase (FAD)